MQKHDHPRAAEFAGMNSLQMAAYVHQQSLTRIRLAVECIRRTDAVLADLSSVWISYDVARFRHRKYTPTR